MKKIVFAAFAITLALCTVCFAEESFDEGFEGYILTHVKKEMSPGWNIEALKAQAVLARTFELNAGRGNCTASADFSLDDGPVRAVKETAGLVLKYDGQPAAVFYHADSGGITTGNSDVWGGKALPYLTAKPDKFPQGTDSSWTKTISREELEKCLNNAGFSIGTPLAFSNVKRDASGRIASLEIRGSSGKASLNGNKFRTLTGLKSTLVNFGGGAPVVSAPRKTAYVPAFGRKRVIDRSTMPEDKRAQLNWFADNRLFSVEEFMRMLAKPEKIDEYIELGMRRLDTANNVVAQSVSGGSGTAEKTEKAPDIQPAAQFGEYGIGETVTFSGKGWGHGVGLPQRQAKAMAENGWDCRQILEYYFPGLILEHY